MEEDAHPMPFSHREGELGVHVLRGGERREEEDRKQAVATARGMEVRLQEGLPLVHGVVLEGRPGWRAGC